jgi:hypothetical protein
VHYSILLLELHHLIITLFKERAAINNGLCPRQNQVALSAAVTLSSDACFPIAVGFLIVPVLSRYRHVLTLAWEVDKFKRKQGFGIVGLIENDWSNLHSFLPMPGILLAIMTRPPLRI